jgi:uncharacterized protein (TIGR02246 family)
MFTDITQALRALESAWNDGDAAGYAALFTCDADYITFFGLHLKGRQAIEDSHRELFAGPLKGSRMVTGEAATIRLLREDVALIVSGGNTTVDAHSGPDSTRDSIVTFTAVRGGDGWLFSSFQNTRRVAMSGVAR